MARRWRRTPRLRSSGPPSSSSATGDERQSYEMSRPSEPIEAIFQRLRHGPGRGESFRLPFHRFYRPLFRFFERRGFSTEERQDLIQVTFIRIKRGVEAFRAEARWR